MKLVRGSMNLWTAGFVVLIALISVFICISIIVRMHSLVVGLLAVLGICLTTFLALWSLFRSLRGNQGKDEFNEMNLRVKEMIELTPGINSHPGAGSKADVEVPDEVTR